MSLIATIRSGTPEDAEGIISIEKECFAKPWSPNFIRRVIESRRVKFFVASIGYTPVGFLMYELSDGYIEIIDMAVIRKLRRGGVGKALFLCLQEKLDSKFDEIYVECRDTNTDAIAFFKSVGMQETDGVLLRSVAFMLRQDV
jgi:ribosomal protein S18 acetylase RimI-like enzyme